MYLIETEAHYDGETDEFRRAKTYVGVTQDFTKRLSQHNDDDKYKRGAKKGQKRKSRQGAVYTRGRRWKPICIVSGFPDKKTALQCEWRMHHPRPRQSGPTPRIRRVRDLCATMCRERCTTGAPLNASLVLTVHWNCVDDAQNALNGTSLKWPSNVEHKKLQYAV